MRTHRTHSSLWLLLTTGLLAAGCETASAPVDQVGSQRAALHRAQSCNDLEALLKQDALAKMNAQIDATIESYSAYGYPRGGVVGGVDNGSVGVPGGAQDPTDTPAPVPPTADDGETGQETSADGSGSGADPAHSETNTQVAGVDEADIIKTDGNNIYVLHGQSFYTLTARPASSLAVGSSLAIEGSPHEMFVADDKVVVYSSVNGAAIYEQAGVTPRPGYYDYLLVDTMVGGGGVMPTPGAPSAPSSNPGTPADGGDAKPLPPDDAEPPPDGGTPSSDGGTPSSDDAPPDAEAPSGGDAPAPPPPDGGAAEPPPDVSDPGSGGVWAPLTKVTVLSLAGGAPSVVKELYFEGGYTSARRTGPNVRTVLTGGAHGPALPYWPSGLTEYPETAEAWTAAFEQLRAENAAIIEDAPLSTWLPYRFEKQGEAVELLDASCSDFYVPEAGTTSYGLTQIESIDLADLAATPESTSIVGATDTVYASHDALYVAARSWDHQAAPGEVFVGTNVTHLHKFDLIADPSQPGYVASGSVSGHIINQFSLDEHDGKLRVSTTSQVSAEPRWTTSNNVFVLEAQGTDLAQIGAVTDLAPGETIQSTRFVGDRGYVVTFRRVDPLFVIDLANPASPSVAGELKIPGFSEYMHPLDDGHLLTIGRDGEEDGTVTGLALQIFDVTNASAPALLHKEALDGAKYMHSEAEYNHKAFTYYGELGVLAFPLVSFDGETGAMSSTLELFNVDIEDGFSRLGAVDHSGFFSSVPSGCYYGGAAVQRGLFIEDYVYSYSQGGVLVNALDDLETPVASLPLPTPDSVGYACVGGGVTEPAPAPEPAPTPEE
ncbi:beta-propeller domain-containing protein [Sorangium atrum]|uniref:Beta-propeller domain-containing protein n=1 Tax=Sorangium atrum TaxID=2995308 RepID=A0ABT5C328_9BACT|nr:beta-propeller domain-containing protein [Sorangium aterium]MDC0679597.1 beta-propeller domain-containing protein [Sorangium aterium]